MKTKRGRIGELLSGGRKWVLIEGDCLNVGRRVPDDSIDAVITDPPYGIAYRGMNDKQPRILNDERPFVWWLYDAYRMTRPGGALLCFCPWRMQERFRVAIEIAGFGVRSQVIWDRCVSGMGHTACTFAPRHDVIWFATKGRFSFPSGRPDSIVAASNVPYRQREHSTQKPRELMERLVRAVTPPGGGVYDPCAGSGSTGVAAVGAGFRFLGVELDPVNAVIARRRLREASRTPRPTR